MTAYTTEILKGAFALRCADTSEILEFVSQCSGFCQIISIPDGELSFETAVGCSASYFVYIIRCSRWFCSPLYLRQCIALFAVAEGWLLLDIG